MVDGFSNPYGQLRDILNLTMDQLSELVGETKKIAWATPADRNQYMQVMYEKKYSPEAKVKRAKERMRELGYRF